MTTRRRRESALEAWAVRWARFRGIVVAKLKECVGVPDRIFFVPGGVPLIVEFKARGEKPEELQSWYLAKLRADGYEVHWCDTKESFLILMKRYVKCRSAKPAKKETQKTVACKYDAARVIQDEEVREMITFLRTSGLGRTIASNTCAMLEELLKLREKVRKDA